MFRNRPIISLSNPIFLATAVGLVAFAISVLLVRQLEHAAIISHHPIVLEASGGTIILGLVGGMLLGVLVVAHVLMLNARGRSIRLLLDKKNAELEHDRQRWHEDVAASKRYESALAFEVSHDSLTGLATPALLRDRFHQIVADRNRCLAWILFIDIDHFKLVNDILNHQAGDLVLCRVSERLLSTVREADTVSRIGGDEFVLLLPEGPGDSLTEIALQRIMDAVAQPVNVEGQAFALSCSVGIAIYPSDGTDVEMLIKHAGIAMGRAKEMGNHHYQFYSPAMNQRALERARIAADLRNGLVRDEFVLHYQPQVDMRSGRVVGMEALIRWHHPELGILPPGRFIGLAEELDLIGPIGAWVLRTACFQNKAWQDAGLGNLRVAVNLSARQFYREDLSESIAAILDESGLSPLDLEVELTESMVMTDVERAIGTLNRLKAIGIQISVDDFGTGYSSLSYLKRFPIDVLKIDQSFVRDITVDPDDALIATSIISLAHSLQLDVIAEGVETAAQLAYLRSHGCDQMQGFYFSPPLPADEFERMLVQGKCLPPAGGGGSVRQQTLLIVDDDIHIISALQRLLRMEDFVIVAVSTAMDGLEAMALHDVQVILCDYRMPNMTGVDFFSKAKELYPDTIRIMLSGYAELESVIDAINRGAVHRFIAKPWDGGPLRRNILDAFRQYWRQHDLMRLHGTRPAILATSGRPRDDGIVFDTCRPKPTSGKRRRLQRSRAVRP